MHRVLSFQMARGFGESTELITKRMCFSFLFSVGFLCLLCGFLIGRFAAARAIDIRAEKIRFQLAGNGLQNNEHLREFFMQRIRENPFATSYVTDKPDEDVRRIKKVLVDLQLFNHVVGNRSCIISTILGSHEPDRYIVLSAIDEGITVVIELCTALKSLKEDFNWNPRRTIIFMISLESSEACHSLLKNHSRAKTVAYIELNINTISGNGHFVTSGSDIVQSTILQARIGIKNPNDEILIGESSMKNETTTCREIICQGFIPRLRLDVPNAIINFLRVNDSSSQDKTGKMKNLYRQAITEIIGTSIWKLSEMTLFKWDPGEDNNILIKILESVNKSEKDKKEIKNIVENINKMTENIQIFNEKIERMETTKSIDVRMANDLSMQVRRLILCNDQDLLSRSDGLVLEKIITNPTNTNVNHFLEELSLCYETANEILQESVS